MFQWTMDWCENEESFYVISIHSFSFATIFFLNFVSLTKIIINWKKIFIAHSIHLMYSNHIIALRRSPHIAQKYFLVSFTVRVCVCVRYTETYSQRIQITLISIQCFHLVRFFVLFFSSFLFHLCRHDLQLLDYEWVSCHNRIEFNNTYTSPFWLMFDAWCPPLVNDSIIALFFCKSLRDKLNATFTRFQHQIGIVLSDHQFLLVFSKYSHIRDLNKIDTLRGRLCDQYVTRHQYASTSSSIAVSVSS